MIYSQILAQTERLIVGPMVTNPGTRDLGGDRLDVRHPQRRCSATGPSAASGGATPRCAWRAAGPTPWPGSTRRCTSSATSPRGARRRSTAPPIRIPWVRTVPAAGLDGGVRAEGAGADRSEGRRLHPPARRPRTSPSGWSRRSGTPRSPPAATRARSPSASPRPRTSPRTTRPRLSPTPASSAAGSAAWSATTSPTWCPGTASTPRSCPSELTEYIKARQGYDYAHHGRAGNPDTAFVPDEIVDRFCLHRPGRGATSTSSRTLRELGVDQFARLRHARRQGSRPSTPTGRRSSPRSPPDVPGCRLPSPHGAPASSAGPSRGPAAHDRHPPTRSARPIPTSPVTALELPRRGRAPPARTPTRTCCPFRSPKRALDDVQLHRAVGRHGPQHRLLDARLRPGRARHGLETGRVHIALANVIVLVPMLLTGHAGPQVRHPLPGLRPRLLRGARRQPARAGPRPRWPAPGSASRPGSAARASSSSPGSCSATAGPAPAQIGGYPWTLWLSFVALLGAADRHHLRGAWRRCAASRTGRRRSSSSARSCCWSG